MNKKKKTTTKDNSIELELSHVKLIRTWTDVPLHGEAVRTRNVFYKATETAFRELEEDRIKILTDMAKKDKKGKPIIENGNFKIDDKQQGEFQTKYALSLAKKVKIEISKQHLRGMVDILLNKMMRSFNASEGIIYDDVLTTLEGYLK